MLWYKFEEALSNNKFAEVRENNQRNNVYKNTINKWIKRRKRNSKVRISISKLDSEEDSKSVMIHNYKSISQKTIPSYNTTKNIPLSFIPMIKTKKYKNSSSQHLSPLSVKSSKFSLTTCSS